MTRQSGGPLSEADYKKINDALTGLEAVWRDIQLALQAGLDCGAEDQLCKDLQTRLNRIKSVYFPHMP